MEVGDYVEVISLPVGYRISPSFFRAWSGDMGLRVGEKVKIVAMNDHYVFYKNGVGGRDMLPRDCVRSTTSWYADHQEAIYGTIGCVLAVCLAAIPMSSVLCEYGSIIFSAKGLTKMHFGDFLESLLSDPLIHDALTRGGAGGVYLVLGGLLLLFLRTLGRSFARWGDHRRRVAEWDLKHKAEVRRTYDEENSRRDALMAARDREETQAYQKEADEKKRRDEEHFAERVVPIIRAAIAHSNPSAVPDPADRDIVRSGTHARFVRTPVGTPLIGNPDMTTAMPAREGDIVWVKTVTPENGRLIYASWQLQHQTARITDLTPV